MLCPAHGGSARHTDASGCRNSTALRTAAIRRVPNDAGAASRTNAIGFSVQASSAAASGRAAADGVGMGDGTPSHAQGVRKVKDNFANRVVAKCGPAVVRVETEKKVELPDHGDADVFSFFFGIRPEKTLQKKVHGHGSGFCIDGQAGIFLTNAHVVQSADRVCVTMSGSRGEPLECEVLGTDEVIDVAALRLKRPVGNLPSVSLGCSSVAMAGDWAIVLGSPLGLQNTCTLGIISSLDRSTGETGFDWMRHPLLQTDAAVNQGNSGGPLLDERGEVIGMISMRALFGEGIGFAVPVDTIKAALPSLLKGMRVPRSYLGLKMSTGDPDGPRWQKGARVEVVLPESPAEAAGFKPGDDILELNGRKVDHFKEVQVAVRSAAVGSRLQFKIRSGEGCKSRTVEVKSADVHDLRSNLEKQQAKLEKQRSGGGSLPRARFFIMQ